MSTSASHTPQPAQRVMVSSTFTDLIPHRDALIHALNDHGLHAEVMEHSGPKPTGDVIDASLDMVRRLELDAIAIQRRLADPTVVSHFQLAGIDFAALVEPLVGRESSIHRFGPSFDRSGPPAINTDRFPRDELELAAVWGKRE